jgi:phosphosulfolactate synthase
MGSSPSRVGPGFLDLPARSAKPRVAGLTHVLDKGLSALGLESLIGAAGEYIDFVKLGWGTAYVAGGVKDKVAVCRDAGIDLCLGGTLLEIAVSQGRLDEYVEWIGELGLDHVEVSNGALAMPAGRKQELIAELSTDFGVIAEVGSKQAAPPAVTSEWVAEIAADLEAGASWIITEGRESGTVGVFEPSGAVRAELVDSILEAAPSERIIFEAPVKDQQAWFLRRVGPDANLGNIAPEEVLSLETLRCGLRADTLDLLPPAPGPTQPATSFL